MAKGGKHERPARPPGMIVTSITVVDLTQGHPRPLRSRLARLGVRRGALLAVVLAAGLVAVAAIALTGLLSGRTTRPPGGHPAPQLTTSERVAIAEAVGYAYPLRCLTIAVFADDRDYATAELARGNGCARYHGYIYATLHRVDGAWRLVLDEGQLYLAKSALPATDSVGVGYPPDCLSAQTLLRDPMFASAGFSRGVCARPR